MNKDRHQEWTVSSEFSLSSSRIELRKYPAVFVGKCSGYSLNSERLVVRRHDQITLPFTLKRVSGNVEYCNRILEPTGDQCRA